MIMKRLLVTTVFLVVFGISQAQEQRTLNTFTNDTVNSATAPERAIVPSTNPKIEAVKRKSNSEVNAEAESKAKTQSNANAKPNPFDKPLSEPAPVQSGSRTNTPVAK